jgi:hypothetical protein
MRRLFVAARSVRDSFDGEHAGWTLLVWLAARLCPSYVVTDYGELWFEDETLLADYRRARPRQRPVCRLKTVEARARATLAAFDVRFYRGWIPERFVGVENRRFCFAHVDVDLYGPTKASLEFFYPRTVRKGSSSVTTTASRRAPVPRERWTSS